MNLCHSQKPLEGTRDISGLWVAEQGALRTERLMTWQHRLFDDFENSEFGYNFHMGG